MVNYKCEICDFSTKKTTDLERHKKTKKHILNIEKYSCGDICANEKFIGDSKKRSKKEIQRDPKKRQQLEM